MARQIVERFHPDDRLMLWFDFFNHDSHHVQEMMRLFMEKVAPAVERLRLGRSMTAEASDSKVFRIYNKVGGHAVRGHEDKWLENINPATAQKISEIPRSTLADVDHAKVWVAQHAFHDHWAGASSSLRADVLEAVADGIEMRLDAFALARSLDNGKPFHLARKVDIPRAIANFRFFAGAIRHDSTDCHTMADALNTPYANPLALWH